MADQTQTDAARLIAAGFTEEDTGGGCLAYVRPTDDGRLQVVTIDDGIGVGIYTRDAWERGEEADAFVMADALTEVVPC
jgi:hypothetical protein